MKTVFSNSSDCLHVYAQQIQESGRSGSISFCQNRIYSYNQCIGNIQGNNIFLINWNYSVTTGKHNSWLRQSTTQFNQIEIKYPETPDSVENIENFETQFNIIVDKLARAKKPEIYISELDLLNNIISNYLSALPKLNKHFVKRLNKIKETNFADSNLLDKAKARLKKQTELAKAKIKESIDKFYNFEVDRVYDSGFSFLRVNGENIETSKGVSIEKTKVMPFVAIYKLWLENKASELLEKLIGKHLDYYTINTVNERFVVIGCHKISASEILKIA